VAARRKDQDTAQALVALAVVGAIAGWWTAARDFVLDRLVFFIPLALALLVLLVLVGRRRVADRRARHARQARLDAQVDSTDAMSGPDFERLVARLMRRDGFTDVRIPGGAGDLGADVVGRDGKGRLVVVQCKRYAQQRRVSSPEMQKFLGTCFHEHEADEAWFVTTARFSKPARELGERRGVRLMDRQQLAGWMLGPAERHPAIS
jgi:restriction system protein